MRRLARRRAGCRCLVGSKLCFLSCQRAFWVASDRWRWKKKTKLRWKQGLVLALAILSNLQTSQKNQIPLRGTTLRIHHRLSRNCRIQMKTLRLKKRCVKRATRLLETKQRKKVSRTLVKNCPNKKLKSLDTSHLASCLTPSRTLLKSKRSFYKQERKPWPNILSYPRTGSSRMKTNPWNTSSGLATTLNLFSKSWKKVAGWNLDTTTTETPRSQAGRLQTITMIVCITSSGSQHLVESSSIW